MDSISIIDYSIDDLKWLNINALAQKVLGAQHNIIGVRYYTARVSGRTDPTAPARQQIYLDALGTVTEISVHLGSFLSSKKFAGLVHPPDIHGRWWFASTKPRKRGAMSIWRHTCCLERFETTTMSLPLSPTTPILLSRCGSSRGSWARS